MQWRYYSATDDWRLDLARRYSIDYFVSKKASGILASRLPIVYENEFYVIQAATGAAK